MAGWTVIVRRPDGGVEFHVVEDADYLNIEPDLYNPPTNARYYVPKNAVDDEVARFNERDIVGIRRSRRVEIKLDLAEEGEGGSGQ